MTSPLLLQALSDFLAYLRVHRDRSLKTLEQYEFHIFSLALFLDTPLAQHPLTSQHRHIFISDNFLSDEERQNHKKVLLAHSQLRLENVTNEDLNAFRLGLVEK